jgi:hypothetical protein
VTKFKCCIPNSYFEDGVLKTVDFFQDLVQEVVDKAESLGAEKVNVMNIIEPDEPLKEGVRVDVEIPDDKKADMSVFMIEYYSQYSWQFGRDEYYYEIDEDSITVHVGV